MTGAAAFLIMGVDKASAKLRRSRVSERALWAVALIGGFIGIFLGAVIFNHKVNKPRFWPPVVAIVILWCVVVAFVMLG